MQNQGPLFYWQYIDYTNTLSTQTRGRGICPFYNNYAGQGIYPFSTLDLLIILPENNTLYNQNTND
jgi:hypothetical protein